MKNVHALTLFCCALALAFASPPRAQAAHGHGHGHGSAGAEIADPAVQFKAGHGLRLNAKARAFIDLSVVEVAARDFGAARGVPAVPEAALLRTVRGTFVFVANGDWLLRTQVKTGPSANGWVAIQEGLYEGDSVVNRGVKALWLSEIQAVNGGVGCADGH